MAFWTTAKPQRTQAVAAVDRGTFKRELDHAYTRGRLAERTRRSGPGLIVLALTTLAAVAVLLLALAVKQGSFAAGGAVVDGLIAQATRLAAAPAAPAPVSRGSAQG
jgi:hypothetical protein